MARQLGHELVDRRGWQGGGGRVVRVADDHDARGCGHLARHCLEVVLAGFVQRHRRGARAGHRGELRVHRERRPGIDELGAWLEHRLGGGEQQLAGAVADRDPAGGHAGALGDALAQRRALRVGVAVERAELCLDRLEHLRVRLEGGLVRGELHELAVEGVRGRRGVHRDVAHARVELEARHCAPWRSRRSDSASRKYTCFGSVSGST